jgi:PAS domain S-box-containing protein
MIAGFVDAYGIVTYGTYLSFMSGNTTRQRRPYDMSIQTNNELAEDRSALPESILEHIADAVIYADPSGTIRRWNHAAASLFGYSATEALGQNLDLVVPEHLRARHWRGFETAMTNGVLSLQGRPTLTRAVHRSGRRLYVEMTFALVTTDAGGAVRGAVAVARDVTERVKQPMPTRDHVR